MGGGLKNVTQKNIMPETDVPVERLQNRKGCSLIWLEWQKILKQRHTLEPVL